MFTLGDTLVLGVALIIILIFRHFDRGNRSLEKLKRFVGHAHGELDAIVAEKVQQLKDLTISVEVGQAAAKRAIEGFESSVEELNNQTNYVEEIQTRINQYDLALKQLVDMTNQAERNIQGIQQESSYVDTVGRRIKDVQKRLESMEKSIPMVIDKFSADNTQQLTAVNESLFESGREAIAQLKEEIAEAQFKAEQVLSECEDRINNCQNDTDETLHRVQAESNEILIGIKEESIDCQNNISKLAETALRSAKDLFTNYQEDYVKFIEAAQSQAGETVVTMKTEALTCKKDVSDVLETTLHSLGTEVTRHRDELSELVEGAKNETGELARTMKAEALTCKKDVTDVLDTTLHSLGTEVTRHRDELSELVEGAKNETGELARTMKAEALTCKKDVTDALGTTMHSLGTEVTRHRDELSELVEGAKNETGELARTMKAEALTCKKDVTDVLDTTLHSLGTEVTRHRDELSELVEGAKNETGELARTMKAEALTCKKDVTDALDTTLHSLGTEVTRHRDELSELVEGAKNETGELARTMKAEALTCKKDVTDALETTLHSLGTEVTRHRDELSELVEGAKNETGELARTMKAEALTCKKDVTDVLDTTLHSLGTEVTRHRDELSELVEGAKNETGELARTMKAEALTCKKDVTDVLDTTLHSLGTELTRHRDELSEFVEGAKNETGELARTMKAEALDCKDSVSKTLKFVQKSSEDGLAHYQHDFSKLEDDFRGRLNQVAEKAQKFELETFHAFRTELELERDKFATSFDQVLEQNKQLFDEKISQYQEDIQRLDSDFNDSFEKLKELVLQEVASHEERVIGGIEKRLMDYEKSITYRLSRLDEISTEVDDLETKLQHTMGKLGEKLEVDMNELGDELKLKQSTNFTEVQATLEELSSNIVEHQNELLALKQNSHANLTEQLLLIEKEFFTDLKERKQAIHLNLEKWTEEFYMLLDNLRREGEEDRGLLEKTYTENFSSQVDVFRNTFTIRINELEGDFYGKESLIRESMNALEDRFNNETISIDGRLKELQKQSVSLLEDRCQEIQEQVSDRLRNIQQDIDSKLQNLNSLIVEQESETVQVHESMRSELSLWKEDVSRQLKNERDGVDGELVTFRVQINETLLVIKEKYNTEKEGVFSEVSSARNELQNGVHEAAIQLKTLRHELDEKKEEVLTRFNVDAQSFLQVFTQEKDSASREIASSIHDFRDFVSLTRSEFETTQKRLIDNLHEETKSLMINLSEIEKRQKGFLQQTKLFERADSLKQGLTEDIEQLKVKINHLQNERKHIEGYAEEFERIRKLGETTNEKMARFTIEQRKLEEIEVDHNRMIKLSSKLDTRLDNINAKYDSVQQMQLAIRNLDGLQRELDQRHERLIKRKEVIDATLEGVDRNFHQLTELDGRIDDMNKIMETVTNEIAVLKNRLESLSINKKESDIAMRNLQNLNQLMDSLEERATEFQKVREWLARTETRMEQVTREANKQVEILGAVTRQTHTAENDHSALSVSERDMVIKLKHQGWNVDDIARTCKISRGEVELILEMTHG